MNGRLVAGGIVLVALALGAAMYWLQVYAFYHRVTFQGDEMRLTALVTDAPEPMLAQGLTGIDSDSSPLRFRACFTTPMSLPMLTETYRIYDGAVPNIAPRWFGCFDANTIGDGLESGAAIAFLGEKNVDNGVDRVVAVFGDGRAFAWHQLNNCGETAYDGSPVGEACPAREE